ncbi:carboxypeptidase regulatory-like domain-containing protein [Alloacidobacterium dinghuense]|uniref:Carboxypeptidase regulatory-like domain-containing protein n=1 Tax=Alloacidobacterium dinghuense TaxID=2763107 RepID=A0A7G8BDY1_9BACT|nr:TonB-dependent receptor [Alloacidobacterium dinghuense]QNI30751.1 carboxypeptidase regulatory-like domain-containing protein [Alloacidobacterium dinghuense]
MTKYLKSLPALCTVVCLFLAFSPKGRAQATTGSITGQVTDATGAVVPNVSITATDINKGITFTGRTDGVGIYVVLNVTPGMYKVTASAPGFETGVALNANIVIDQKLLLNFRLRAGAVDTTVVVTQAPTMLQTQSSETGAVMETQDITDLPLQGRNFFALPLLVPGVVSVGGSINSFALSVNGNREYGNSIKIDGVESTTNRTQDVTVIPSVDSVQEFKVSTSAYNAEFGSSAGGVVSIQTKAGTNQFHGVAYEFFRPNFTAARPYGFSGATVPPSILKQHNYGGTLGGPIVHNKAFFFGSYERTKLSNAYTYLDSTPPTNQINFLPDGSVDLSQMVDPNAGTKGVPAGIKIPIFDPSVSFACYGGCSQQFPGNIIPASRVSPAGKSTLLDFFARPNLPGTSNGWYNNYFVDSPVTTDQNQVDARYDQEISSKDRLYLTYHYLNQNQLVTDPYNGATVVPGGGDADQGNKEDLETQTLSASYTHIFSPTTLNEFRFGYSRYAQNQFSLLSGTDYSTKYGVGNIAVPGYEATVGYPQIFMGTGYLAGGSTYKPYHVLDSNYAITDNFTWSSVARHEFKFGEEFRRLSSRPVFSLFPTGFEYYGSFGFSQTADPTYSYFQNGAFFYNGGSDVADLLLGLPFTVDIGLQLTQPHTQSWNLGLYAQDTFKVSPQLTLNYGLRYEFQDPYVESNNYESNVDVASGFILLAGRGGNARSLMVARKNDIAPRVGFSYLINNNTVVRGGYGLFFSPENDGREDFLTQNNPFAQQAVYTNYWYDGPPYEYVLDTGVARDITINAPASGKIDPSTLANGKLETTYAVRPNLKTGVSQLFNMAVQRELSTNLSLEVAYVGSLAHNLSYQIGDVNANADGSEGQITPYLGKIQYLGDYGSANFNSMQVKFTKRESHNLSFLLSYTYGHSFDNGPAPFNLGKINNDEPQNPYNLPAEWGSSDSDVRQNFVFSGLYRLPFGHGQKFFSNWGRTTNMLLGGWQLNSIYVMQSGLPVNVVRVNNPTSAFPGLRPDQVSDPNIPRSQRTLMKYFNTDAFSTARFTCPTCDANAPGNAARNIVRGPGNINLDSSLFKELQFTERYRLQLRLEAFNTLNTPHFANPDGDLANNTFGEITRTTGNMRIVQIAGKFIF